MKKMFLAVGLVLALAGVALAGNVGVLSVSFSPDPVKVGEMISFNLELGPVSAGSTAKVLIKLIDQDGGIYADNSGHSWNTVTPDVLWEVWGYQWEAFVGKSLNRADIYTQLDNSDWVYQTTLEISMDYVPVSLLELRYSPSDLVSGQAAWFDMYIGPIDAGKESTVFVQLYAPGGMYLQDNSENVAYNTVTPDVYWEQWTYNWSTTLQGKPAAMKIAVTQEDGEKVLYEQPFAASVVYTTDLSNWVTTPAVVKRLCLGKFSGLAKEEAVGLDEAGNLYYSWNVYDWYFLGGTFDQLAIGDFNGDGKDDAAGLTKDGQVYYTLNLYNWVNVPGQLWKLYAGDLNGDGKADLIGLTSSGKIYYALDLANWKQIQGQLWSLAIGDFNGDGKEDIAGIGGNGEIYYALDLANFVQIPGQLWNLSAGDLNGDGKEDLAGISSGNYIFYTLDLANWNWIWGYLSEVKISKGSLVGLTTDGQLYWSSDLVNWNYGGSNLSQIAIGDVNGDGQNDVVGIQ